MKRSYVKPELNASMNGTLEGVYAYACGPWDYVPYQPDCKTSSNKEESSCDQNYDQCSGWVLWFHLHFRWWF